MLKSCLPAISFMARHPRRMLDAAIAIGIYQRQLHTSMRHFRAISCLDDRSAFMVFAKLSRYRQCGSGYDKELITKFLDRSKNMGDEDNNPRN